MHAIPPRPAVPEMVAALDTCARCDARGRSVCDAIPDSGLHRLNESSTAVSAADGTTFITEGEPAGAFFNITSGAARLFKLLPDGRRQITGFAGAGQFLGLAVSETYAFSAEAIGTVRFCRFPRAKLRALLDEFPAMEKRLLRLASNELVAAQEQMLLLGRKTARERVASFLLAQARLGADCQQTRSHFALPMTRGDVADYVGLTIETVSRTLTKLRADGLVDIPNVSDIIIRNRPALERIAEGLN